MVRTVLKYWLPVAVLLAPLTASAVELKRQTFTINITVVRPTCNVTTTANGSTLSVAFGNLKSWLLNTADSQVNMPLKVTCTGAAPTGEVLRMRLIPGGQGTMAWGSNTVLATTKSGVGISITDNADNLIAPGNTWYEVQGISSTATPNNNLTFKAQVVTDMAPRDVTGGAFSASATLTMEYR